MLWFFESEFCVSRIPRISYPVSRLTTYNLFCCTSPFAKMPYCDYCVNLPTDRSGPDFRGFSWSGCNALDAYVLCFQSLSKFPSWTSRVRVPSPAPESDCLGLPGSYLSCCRLPAETQHPSGLGEQL